MREQELQNHIRNALAGHLYLWRINTGKAWQGNHVERLPLGRVLIHDARPFDTGVPAGFSDLFGVKSVVITPDMVGMTIARGVFGEVKLPEGRVSPKQEAFRTVMRQAGAAADVWRSVDQALACVAAA